MPTRNAGDIKPDGKSDGVTPSPAAFGLRSVSKIRDLHLDRLAMVYVRQSSPQQVLENRESRERQYALAEFAQRLGWPAERVVVVDEDQGQSGRSAENRSGFQRLMTEVSLNHVGIVLGLELSRLSRSNKDWHQLIDVCGIFNTLLCDQDGVYDPLDSNDRLLLGMKGAMSEFELVTLRNRLLRGSRNKAERGELFLHVPLGYLKTPAGEVVQEPDEQARGMIRLVFEKFDELGSAYAVFRYLILNDLRLGFRRQRGGRIGELEWRPPSPARIFSILRHPIYAGAYAYGMHRAGTKDPVTGRARGGRWFVPPEEMAVLLHDRVPAYISWDRYLANQEKLRQNRSLLESQGVPKRGEALLPGLVVCGKCGRRMSARYKTDKRPSYYCGEYWRLALDEPCGHIAAAALDDLVAREVLRALEPAALELSLRAIEDVEHERKRLHDHWRQTLERAKHEVGACRAAVPGRRAREPPGGPHAGIALGRGAEVATPGRGGLPPLPGQAATDVERRGPGEDPVPLGQRRHAVARAGDLGGGPQAGRAVPRGAGDRRDRQVERAQRRDDRVAGRLRDAPPGRPACCHLCTTERYSRLDGRVTQLHREGLHLAQIAARLNAEGFVPPRRRGGFTASGVGELMRDLGLVGELFRDDLVGEGRVVDPRPVAEARRDPPEGPLLGQAGLGPRPPHPLGKALDCLGGSGRAPAAPEAGEAEELLDRRPRP